MNTTRLEEDEDFPYNAEVYASGLVLSRAICRVVGLFNGLFDGTKILVIEDKGEAAREVLSFLEKDPKTKVIVINLGNGSYTRDASLLKILKYPNVRCINKINDAVTDLVKYGDELKNINEEGEASFKIDAKQREISGNIMGILQHDLKPYVLEEKGERYRDILNQAREAFSINPRTSDESVVEFILSTKRNIEKVFEGFLEGVYCDIDDTILRPDGTIIEETLLILEKYEKEGKKICIWTGGDLEIAKRKLSETPFSRFPIVSKHDFAGAEAEVVIDNVSPEKFALQTGITARKFIRID